MVIVESSDSSGISLSVYICKRHDEVFPVLSAVAFQGCVRKNTYKDAAAVHVINTPGNDHLGALNVAFGKSL